MVVDVSGDSIVLVDAGGTLLEKVRFQDEFNVGLKATSGFRIRMSPRGHADEDCNSYTSTVTLEFWLNTDSSTVRILLLGQLVY